MSGKEPNFVPITRIRVETALSRFPIHNLAKSSPITIDLQRTTEQGDTDLKWTVSHSARHGIPGPLAYKVDTLIVNRRIDSAPRPLPESISLGSLTEICQEMGRTDSGENRSHLRKALLQNAFAAITAKIKYRTKSGAERWTEIGYSRYSIVFTGETLPDGSQADAVYILLSTPYRELLNQVEVRPLDYDYLKELPPAAQRLYELLSFQIYGAIANGRPRAKMLYSDYCKFAPQARYPDYDHVKKQMHRLHKVHKDSGYIERVDYEKKVDTNGIEDWEMFYTPGPKAFAEYRAFTHRQARQQSSTESVNYSPTLRRGSTAEFKQASLDFSESESTLVEELNRRGVTLKKARDLIATSKTGQDIMAQIFHFDNLMVQDVRKTITNPTGFLISLIRDNVSVPGNPVTNSTSYKLDSSLDVAGPSHTQQVEAHEEYCDAQVNSYILEDMPESEYREAFSRLRKLNRAKFRSMTVEQLNVATRKSVAH